MRDVETIISDIQQFSSDNDDWTGLDWLVEEACVSNDQRVIKPLLGLLERNPDHDGYGIFWSIIHGLEAMGGYEADLLSSVLSSPHEMSVLMLNRMLNGNIRMIYNRLIIDVLEEVAENEDFPASVREDAKRYSALHV